MAAGIAINFDRDGTRVFDDVRTNTIVESLASAFGIGVGLDDDFVENVDTVAGTLHEKHAHGVDVEIDGPDDGAIVIEFVGDDVFGGAEGIIRAVFTDGGKFGFEFLAVTLERNLAGGEG